MSKELIITAQAIVLAPVHFNSTPDVDTLESIRKLVKVCVNALNGLFPFLQEEIK